MKGLKSVIFTVSVLILAIVTGMLLLSGAYLVVGELRGVFNILVLVILFLVFGTAFIIISDYNASL